MKKVYDMRLITFENGDVMLTVKDGDNAIVGYLNNEEGMSSYEKAQLSNIISMSKSLIKLIEKK